MSYTKDTTRHIDTLRTWIDAAKPGDIVFFGGAGVSTESGIPDFRSADGLYSQKYGNISPETLISRSYFDAHPQTFFEFYFDRMIAADAKPNRAHNKLAALETNTTLRGVVTQNIDGLHQKAGSKTVYELHGSVLRNFCTRCDTAYDLDSMIALHREASDGIPRCNNCKSIVKPDVVLYEEPLDHHVMKGAIQAIQQAKLLIIAGTSLVVYPAAGLIDYFRGDHVAIINLAPTPRDRAADLCIAAKVGDVFDF